MKRLILIFAFLAYALPVWSISWDNPVKDCSNNPETALKSGLIYEGTILRDTVNIVGKEGLTVTWDASVLGDGKHTVGVVLTDQAGNRSDTCSETPTIEVDNGDHTPPAACTNLK